MYELLPGRRFSREIKPAPRTAGISAFCFCGCHCGEASVRTSQPFEKSSATKFPRRWRKDSLALNFMYE